ncbi:MAG TPA: hypothetical protein VEU08_06040 [Vicinamibacterales bacterium]|nr:hypothetical protein [Vicinamibacterales bacterium]
MTKLLWTVTCGFVVAAFAAPLVAQQQSLADVAKQEEERRKEIKRPAKVITNKDLNPARAIYAQPIPNSTDAAAAATGDKKDDKAAGDKSAAGGDVKDQKYWGDKKKTLQQNLDRDSGYAEALQVRINALTADFVNRDDPVQKRQIEQDRIKALAELDRLKKSIDDDKKALTDLEEDARKAGVPPGWIR